ncbi:PD-(D/E)XK nuclease family protein [Exiguobacterium sp. SL14]|nr:PD-(D/E)XK nuclease family protein [Exiguobacterium sp. SL14]MCY1692031.1 PD-(D/E)XK nuclease family protein [Exiguobacterium sp. SL14]
MDEVLLPENDRRQAKSYAEWVVPAVLRSSLLRPDETDWSIRVMSLEELAPYQEISTLVERLEHVQRLEKIDVPVNSQVKEFVESAFAYQYPHLLATETAAKQTVTELKRAEQLERAPFETTYRQTTYYRTPQFLGPVLSGAERGTVLHLAMQLYEPDEAIAQQIDQWEATERITPIEATTMREATAQLQGFLDSEIGQLFCGRLRANQVYRELPFTYKIEASRFRKDWTGPSDDAVMQGIVDCLIQDGESYILLDYKSDQIVTTEIGQTPADVLRERYATQLNLYQEALEAILHIQISRKVIYAFALNETIDLV